MSIGTTIQPTLLVDKIGNRICTQDSRVQKTNFTTENLVPKIPKKIVITGVGKTPNEDPRRFAMNLFGTDGIRGTYGSTVTDGTVNGGKPGDITKITVVIWLEGNDPDCTDNILGGQFKLDMIFDIVGMGES